MRTWNVGQMFALLVVGLFAMACFCNSDEKEEPSRWEKSEKKAAPAVVEAPTDGAKPTKEDEPAKPAPEQVKGGSFNAAFPDDGVDGMSRAFTQEKEGYAEAKYTKGDDELVLSVSDTSDQPDAAAKFAEATEKLQGYPLMTRGKNGSMVLVKDRIQVKVTSKTLDAAARAAFLEKVKLDQLAQLAK